MPLPTHAEIDTAMKILVKTERNMTSSGVVSKEEAEAIYDALFQKKETDKMEGPMHQVEAAYQHRAWLRTILYFITYTTSEKVAKLSKNTYKVYINAKRDDRITINSVDVRKIINGRGYKIREFFRRFAFTAIKLLKDNPQWAPRLVTKWAVPIEKYYLAVDFADRLSLTEIRELGLTNEDLVVINNLTYANTERAARAQIAQITSGATIFNPGYMAKPLPVSHMITN